MTTSSLGFEAYLKLPHEEAIEATTQALKKEGFGILNRIDLHEVFQEKLQVSYELHTILGACHPKLAHQAVMADPEAALLLPCNVTVEETLNGSIVRVVNPREMLHGAISNPEVQAMAKEAEERVHRAIEGLNH